MVRTEPEKMARPRDEASWQRIKKEESKRIMDITAFGQSAMPNASRPALHPFNNYEVQQ